MLQENRTRTEFAAARRATQFTFLVMGTATSSWAPMIPFVKTGLGLDEAALGLLLLALGGGGIVAMPLSGVLMHRFGIRAVIRLSGLLSCFALLLPPLAPDVVVLALSLVLFGGALGALDVAGNAHAVLVERRSERPLMSGFHALYSIGGLVGAGGMTLLLKSGLPLPTCAAAIALLLVVLFLSQWKRLLAEEDGAAGDQAFVLPRRAVIALGLLAFIVFLAEGAVLDWSAVLLRFDRGFEPEIAGIGYAAFSLAMAFGRLTGDSLTRRLGPVTILRLGSVTAALGFTAAVALPWDGAALAGFVLVGLGAANLVPVLFSAAGRVPDMRPSVAVPAVATLGYAGLLAGPALIGFAAELSSLPMALGAIALLLLAVAGSGRVLRA